MVVMVNHDGNFNHQLVGEIPTPLKNMKVNGKDYFHFRIAARNSARSLRCKSETLLPSRASSMVVWLNKRYRDKVFHDKIGKFLWQHGCRVDALKGAADE